MAVPAAAVAADDDALDAVRTPQRLGGRNHVAGVDAGSDVGRRKGHRLAAVVFGDQRHGLDGEAEPLAGLTQRVDVAGRLLAEREVLADDDLDHVQPFDQQFVDVALGSELHEVGGERHHQEDVDAEFLDEFGPAGQRRQLGRMTAREHHFHGVGVEGHQHRRHPAGPAGLHRPRDQFGVPAVHTVEDADGQHTPAPV